MRLILLVIWQALSWYSQTAVADFLPENQRCVTAVYSALNYISFTGSPAVGTWNTRCRNPLKVTSIYAASQVFCREHETVAGLAQLEHLCREFGRVELLPRKQVESNLTEDAIRHMPVVDYLEIPQFDSVENPVLISRSYFDRMFRTIDTWQYEMWAHHAYGYMGYAYWAAVLLVGMLHRLYQQHISHRRVQYLRFNRCLIANILTPIRVLHGCFQTHLVIPGPFGSRSRRVLWFTFPTRIEAVIIILFWALSTVLCCTGYRTFSGNIYWPNISQQVIRYVADRTGIVSFANLPLLWVFAGRNNIFLWATGWSFSTFSLFHRHVAWIATMQAVVHTVAYLFLFFQAGNKVWKQLSKAYILWGTAALLVMLIILPFAMDVVRHRSYEMFLLTHVFFSIVAVVGFFYHTVLFEGEGYWDYLWPVVWVWGIDRLLRLARLIYCNLHVRSGRGRTVHYTRSTASYDDASDVIRLVVIPGRSLIYPAPGHYYFLYQPFRLKGWESHPFTLGAWTRDANRNELQSSLSVKPTTRINDSDTVDVAEIPLLSDSSADPKHDWQTTSTVGQQEFIFWIRPFSGWTLSLRNRCLRSQNYTTNATILLEGPYGDPVPLWKYGSVLLIAGGTGIASAVPYILGHLSRSGPTAELSEETSTSRIHDLHLVWTSRQIGFIQDLAANELRPAFRRDEFHHSFYTTSKHPASNTDGVDGSKVIPVARDTDTNGETGPKVRIQTGTRPDLQAIVLEHARKATADGSTAAILVCGPSGMAESVRAAMYSAMREGCSAIRYVEESFSW